MENPSAFQLYTSTIEKLQEIAKGLGVAIPDGFSRFDIIDLIRLFEKDTPETEAVVAAVAAQSEASPSATVPGVQQRSVRIQRIRDNNP